MPIRGGRLKNLPPLFLKGKAMAVLKIVKIGSEGLRRKCRCLVKAEIKTPKFKRFLNHMVQTMRSANGVGIAANQVGVSQRAIAMECRANKRYPKAGEFPLSILINPRILKYSKETVTDWEGCLSIPGYRGLVPRAQKVTFEALTPEGEKVVRTVEGFQARVIQHEVDHIMGHFYIDRMPDLLSWIHLDEFNQRFHTRIK